MKYVKILLALVFLGGVGYGGYYMFTNTPQMQFKSVCEKGHKRYTKYCEHVGKYAWTQQSVLNINEKNYGKIIGVAWRKKDSIISSRTQKKKRRSEKNAYYYIIGDKKDAMSQFLMMAEQIDPRTSKTKTKVKK